MLNAQGEPRDGKEEAGVPQHEIGHILPPDSPGHIEGGQEFALSKKPVARCRTALGDRTYKLASGTTSEYGRCVKYPGGAP